ncbi:type IV secretion system protein VirB10 [Bordetella ansorpii]|nr:type IV secretion system protein VirB10 [Bordetella ansorpii]
MKWPRLRRSTTIDAVDELERSAANDIGARGPGFNDTPRRTPPRGAKAFMLLMMVVIVGALGGLTWRALHTAEGKKKSADVASRVENVLPRLKLQPSTPAPTAPPSEPAPPIAESQPSRATDPPPRPFWPVPEVTASLPDMVQQRRLSSPLAGEREGRQQNGTEPSNSTPPPTGDSGPMADGLQPLRLSGSSARLLPDRNYLLTQGAMIDCVMQTRLVSAQAGMVTCHTPREVRSANGRVVLIDAGTLFVGYQRGSLSQGQRRIGVVWSRLETPNGVAIELDSPGTGPLGEAGLDGAIDSHFWERFGGAVMISLIDDFGNWVSEQNRGGDSIRFDSTGDAAAGAVEKVLENSINIPPTLYKNMGERIGIFVARDLDFSSVYQLVPTSR